MQLDTETRFRKFETFVRQGEGRLASILRKCERKDVLRKPFKLFEGSNEYAVAITVEYFPDVENKETVLVKDRFVLVSKRCRA